jgi:uncharacterized protein Usg
MSRQLQTGSSLRIRLTTFHLQQLSRPAAVPSAVSGARKTLYRLYMYICILPVYKSGLGTLVFAHAIRGLLFYFEFLGVPQEFKSFPVHPQLLFLYFWTDYKLCILFSEFDTFKKRASRRLQGVLPLASLLLLSTCPWIRLWHFLLPVLLTNFYY